MIICDECKSLIDKAHECRIVLQKFEPASGKKRAKSRDVVTIPIALCEGCISKLCSKLGKLKNAGFLKPVPPAENQ